MKKMFNNKKTKEQINVMIAEDHPMTARLISRIVNSMSGYFVSGIASDGREAVSMVRTKAPDLMVMDIDMPLLDGISAMEMILSFSTDVRFVIISAFDDDWIIRKAVFAGASAFISKKSGLDCLKEALTVVPGGGSYLDDLSLKLITEKYQTSKITAH